MAKKILIAEDDEDIRIAVKILIEQKGYDVYEAQDGVKALEMAKDIIPDLIIMDVMMPGKVGYQVCRELKSEPATENIYIIFLTARGDQAEEAALACGGDELLSKPFDVDILRDRVHKALER
jgi:two-component system, OmpR family, alkaline phosphatase synthesis response regulator PhoP